MNNTLYRPQFEHDACGIGFMARTTGIPGHDIVKMGLEAVGCMAHRSGIDADGLSGDGAGMLTQIPHRLLATEIDSLPAQGDYAVGMLFLPPDDPGTAAKLAEETIINQLVINNEQLASGNKQLVIDDLIWWRSVPVDANALGKTAQRTRPEIRQIIVRRPDFVERGEAFERLLLSVRKRLVTAYRAAQPDEFYVASLSAQTVVYKGLMLSPYLADFYLDLANPLFESAVAVVHARYSTNTTSNWHRAQPLRMLAHNGEINTIQGNENWMHARESNLNSPHWPDMEELRPIVDPHGSDSSRLDNVLELLVRAGRDVHHSMAMLAPEAWESLIGIHPDRYAFYRYHAALMEPWDGPAAIMFTDGQRVGATLDRNGLRPLRYLTTSTDLVVATSEAGAVNIDEGIITTKGKLGPGQMILVDMERQLFLTNDQVKNELARRPQYQQWVSGFKPLATETRPANFSLRPFLYQAPPKVNTTPQWLTRFQAAFGYTNEEITVIVRPMAAEGKEPTGSMGDDAALAIMSAKPRPLFHYFKQRFAQVTNPPIDPLRETFVMSLTTRLGRRPNLLAEYARHAYMIELTSPVLTDLDLDNLKGTGDPRFQTYILPARYPIDQHEGGLKQALKRLCTMAERAIDEGKTILILSDHGIDERHAPVPSLLAVGAVHQHLVKTGKRMQVSLVAETGEVREVHHLACLIGFGANAVNPYLALATVEGLVSSKKVKLELIEAKRNYVRALEAGLLKIMSKMGISTVESYAGAQIFEAIGLSQELVDEFFTGTVSRLGGIGLKEIADKVERWHQPAFENAEKASLDSPGFYKFKRGGELHAYTPQNVKALHTAARMGGVLRSATEDSQPAKDFAGENFEAGYAAYRKFVKLLTQSRTIGPRDVLDFVETGPVDISEVEPPAAIFPRLSTAAMSHGALSSEAHETLAIAMNRLGAKSNSGEGGSAQDRFGTGRNDRAKQIASGRFGVTPAYLMSADEIQIKMAQGAKPGEGGQLPGHKVSAEIAAIRHTTEGTTLISPPPHHDIYSIEDLAQLIYDLKQINPPAEVSVKLVAEAGVGTVAAGVVKGGADIIHLSGHSGGTGAAAWSSIKNVGLPWEIGLAEVQQTLQMNDLRGRVKLRTDGGLQTGRDVVVGAILGADEFSFGTAALVAEGCLMARACHRNTCPAGVATQRPALRAKFAGAPEHVMAYFHYVAREVRQILAQLGCRSLAEIIGRTELLRQVATGNHATDSLNLSPLLEKVDNSPAGFAGKDADALARLSVNDLNGLLLVKAEPTVRSGKPLHLNLPIGSTDRTIGATLSGAIARQHGDRGLPDGTINVTFNGSAGQSFGAFNSSGLSLTLVGEANDYVGKGMNGGQIVVRPSLKSQLVAGDNTIIGNTVLYGATGGSMFVAGQAGERFGVRNSGATAVVEGVGDHGCEYMTGGTVIVLGRTGYNFGAGMSGGVAFVLDESDTLPQRVNPDMVQVVRVASNRDIGLLRMLIVRHVRLTGSEHGQAILDNWSRQLGLFWKIAPKGSVGATAVRVAGEAKSPTSELSQHVVG